MNQIELDGITYPSVAAAWRAQSPATLKLITVRLRLRAGWSIEDAFWYMPVDPMMRRGFQKFRNEHSYCDNS